jgi:biopolymer transport protein ExbB
MWLLLATSIFGLGLIIDRVRVFYRWRQKFGTIAETLEPLISSGDWAHAAKYCERRGPFTNMAAVYLRNRHRPKEVREDLLRREGLLIVSQLDNGVRWLAVTAQVATLMGLLATFHVMITRFHNGSSSGGQMQPTDFTSAIWEALLTTMYGLMIAIPCSASYQIMEARIDAMTREFDILVSCLDEWCRTAAALEQDDRGDTSTDDVPRVSVAMKR